MSKPKEVYQTLKKSISATTNGLMSNTLLKSDRQQSSKDGTIKWIHPPDTLIRGRVNYGVKMLGQVEVAEPKGAHVIRDAIHAINFQVQVNRSLLSSAEAKPKKVELQINTQSVTIVDLKSKLVLHRHLLNKISFCADDKRNKRVFAYIAVNDDGKYICYLFRSDKLAEQITLTIGEAFDLALQQYIQEKGLNKPIVKDQITESESDDVAQLKKRIAELEFENRYMKNEIQSLQRRCGIPLEPVNIPKMSEVPPMIPDTPVPMVPLAFRNITNTPPAIASIDPPPNTIRRPKTVDLLAGVELNGPEVGKKLENLNLDKMDDVFDNDFDPRSAEKKDTFGLEPFGPTPSLAEGAIKNHADELKQMLGECDQKIQQVTGFNHASFEFGDLGALGQEEEYVTPSTTYEK